MQVWISAPALIRGCHITARRSYVHHYPSSPARCAIEPKHDSLAHMHGINESFVQPTTSARLTKPYGQIIQEQPRDSIACMLQSRCTTIGLGIWQSRPRGSHKSTRSLHAIAACLLAFNTAVRGVQNTPCFFQAFAMRLAVSTCTLLHYVEFTSDGIAKSSLLPKL